MAACPATFMACKQFWLSFATELALVRKSTWLSTTNCTCYLVALMEEGAGVHVHQNSSRQIKTAHLAPSAHARLFLSPVLPLLLICHSSPWLKVCRVHACPTFAYGGVTLHPTAKPTICRVTNSLNTRGESKCLAPFLLCPPPLINASFSSWVTIKHLQDAEIF